MLVEFVFYNKFHDIATPRGILRESQTLLHVKVTWRLLKLSCPTQIFWLNY